MGDVATANVSEVLDCLKTIDLDGRLSGMDHDGMCLMEIDDFSAVAGQPWASLWPVESQPLVTASVHAARNGKVARFSADCPTAKGKMKSWEVSVAPVRDAGGQIIAIQSLSHDVTKRELDRRETALVSQELAHRIKNLFAVVDSLIHLSGSAQPEVQTYVKALRQRLGGLGRAIAFIHPLNASDMSPAPRSVKGLIAALLAPFEEAGALVSVTGDDAEISQDAVTSFAMVLNELATNAVKYGAMKDGVGRLAITLTRQSEDFIIDWRESGVTVALEAQSSGFGTTLLDRTVRSQFSGSITRDWDRGGLAVQIRLPLARLS